MVNNPGQPEIPEDYWGTTSRDAVPPTDIPVWSEPSRGEPGRVSGLAGSALLGATGGLAQPWVSRTGTPGALPNLAGQAGGMMASFAAGRRALAASPALRSLANRAVGTVVRMAAGVNPALGRAALRSPSLILLPVTFFLAQYAGDVMDAEKRGIPLGQALGEQWGEAALNGAIQAGLGAIGLRFGGARGVELPGRPAGAAAGAARAVPVAEPGVPGVANVASGLRARGPSLRPSYAPSMGAVPESAPLLRGQLRTPPAAAPEPAAPAPVQAPVEPASTPPIARPRRVPGQPAQRRDIVQTVSSPAAAVGMRAPRVSPQDVQRTLPALQEHLIQAWRGGTDPVAVLGNFMAGARDLGLHPVRTLAMVLPNLPVEERRQVAQAVKGLWVASARYPEIRAMLERAGIKDQRGWSSFLATGR